MKQKKITSPSPAPRIVDLMADPPSTQKREYIRNYEKEIQKYWEEEKIFEKDAKEGEETFLGTFPYPYMNGRLHLGHAFTACKVDFAVGFQTLKGKRALFPFGFHCTGMPIKACADKLKREMEDYGHPPKFPEEVEKPLEEEIKPTKEKKKEVGKSNKSKTQQKGSGAKFQWEIMLSSSVPAEDIHKFADADYWLRYFPPLAMGDLKGIGAKIDWRRQFLTTDVNPYYDAFVRWQFNKLKKDGKIKFGKRETIFSPLDNQPCMDHDRQTGEGVGVGEYTLVKQKLLKPYPRALRSLEKHPQTVYLVPATLRPETMYGQTNCWVLPSGLYGAFLINQKEIFVCTHRAARNLAFQEMSPEPGKVVELLSFRGDDLIGAALNAPLSKYPVIYVYPMFTVSTKKTTGIVTSVPSDSPDDYAAFRDVKLKPQIRQKYGLREDQVNGFEVVPIIEIPDYGKLSAVKVVEDLKINSQNDAEKLKEAKEKVYKEGFYEGVMLVGEHKGKKVNEVKPLIKQYLIKQGLATRYYEPKKTVISRSGDTCVVALCDQWYLDYGEPSWQAQALKCLSRMDTFGEDVRNQFIKGFDWMHEWACSRSYGLGSRIPWDTKYLIESLSDSTIYMAYYTISHLLQGGIVDGSKPGPSNIAPEQLTDEVFDFIFAHQKNYPHTKIPKAVLDLCRKEFELWYPVSVRVSGKDLINNHLIFWIYNHVALFPEEKWPKSVKANGHLLLNGEKMAKRTGNFITLGDAVRRYSADGSRFALAEAGDSIEDPNFTTENADNDILRLHTFVEWCKEMVAEKSTMKSGPPKSFAERVLNTIINQCISDCDAAYERMLYQKAIKVAFFDMMQARDHYRQVVLSYPHDSLNWDLILKFMETVCILCAPIVSHTSEHVWRSVLGNKNSIFFSTFPKSQPVDRVLIQANNYINQSVAKFRLKIGTYMKPKKGQNSNPHPHCARILVAVSYPQWQQQVLNILRDLYVKNNNNLPKNGEIANIILTGGGDLVKQVQKVMDLVNTLREEVVTDGVNAFSLTTPFNEKEVLTENIPYLQNTLKLEQVEVLWTTDPGVAANEEPLLALGSPGKPLIFFS